MISSYKLQEPIYTGQTLPVLQRPEQNHDRQQVRAPASLVALQTLPDTLREGHRTAGHPQQPAAASESGSEAHLWVPGPEHTFGMVQSSHRTALHAEVFPRSIVSSVSGS